MNGRLASSAKDDYRDDQHNCKFGYAKGVHVHKFPSSV
jgi:hypothetical protein